MPGRPNEEWIGRSPSAKIPWYVIERLLERAEYRCQGPCHCEIGPGTPFDVDHIMELADGGENRESNLQIMCRKVCHRTKSKLRHMARGSERRLRRYHYGWKKPKHPMPGSRASKWKKQMDGTVVLRFQEQTYEDDNND